MGSFYFLQFISDSRSSLLSKQKLSTLYHKFATFRSVFLIHFF